MPSSIKNKFDWKCFPFILLIAFILAARFKLIFSYSFDLDGAEYTYVHAIQRLLMGHSMYNDSLRFPFNAVVYTPLYYCGYYGICKLLQLDYLKDIHSIYIVGRTLSFTFFLFQSALLYTALKRYGLSLFQRLMTLALFTLLITGGFFIAKMDGIKVFFFTLFILFLIDHFFYGKSSRSAALSLLAGVIAVSIKQDAIIYIGISILVLFAVQPWKKAFSFGLLFVVLLSFALAIYHFVFGAYFFRNITLYNFQLLTNFSVASKIHIIILFSIFRTGALLLICLLNLYTLFKKKKRHSAELSAELYVCLLAFVFFTTSHITMLRPGAYLNYSYEAVVLLSLNFAVFLKANVKIFESKTYLKTGLTAAYFLLLFAIGHLLHFYSNKEPESKFIKTIADYSAEKVKIDSVVGNSLVFFPAPKYAILFADRNVIYGYEYHADRYINLLEGLEIKSKLLFADSKNYDEYFTSGKVKYIVIENKPANKEHVQKYYPLYALCHEMNNFIVFCAGKH